MGSILDFLPHEGALFWGRSGALPLADGRFLQVTPGAARVVTAAIEPPDNRIAAPDESLPVRRPAYLDAVPFVAPLPPQWYRPGEGIHVFRRLWPKRHEPDDYVRRDPYTGGMIRVAQAVRAVAGAGSKPLALSYRLTGGDPSDPEAAYRLRQAVQGMADAASMLTLPVLAGELRLRADPASDAHTHAAEPAADPELRPGSNIALEVFAHAIGAAGEPLEMRAGDAVALAGRMTNDLSGSLYLDGEPGFPPPLDLIAEGRVLELVRAFGGGWPLGRGGLLLTLAGCCARASVGARLSLPEEWRSLSPAAVLFGEAQSRFLVSLSPSRVPELLDLAEPLAVPVGVLGELGGADLSLDGLINLDVRELQ